MLQYSLGVMVGSPVRYALGAESAYQVLPM